MTRVNGELTEVVGFLQNIAAIKTKGIDVNLAYRGLDTGGSASSASPGTTPSCATYDVIVPGSTGNQVLSREGTEVGSSGAGLPQV